MVFRVAIDGPAASGKGTIARGVAEGFGFAHLESGLVYRAAARRLLDLLSPGDDLNDERLMATLAVRAARAVVMEDLNGPGLRGEEIADVTSRISALGEVRDVLRGLQRSFADAPPGGVSGVVIDGRDIATVVMPDADVKIYVDADVCVRAGRRAVEEGRDLGEVLAEIEARDGRDSGRRVAPLRCAEGAILLDTSHLTIEESIASALEVIRTARAGR